MFSTRDLHPFALLLHHLQMRQARFPVHIRLGKGNFEKTVDHRQGRAQFMRRIGNEITTDFFDPDRLGLVMRDQNLAAVLKRDDLQDQTPVIEGSFQAACRSVPE